MLLISALVHLLNLYPCILLLFSGWLLSYCHPCPRIAARRNDRNSEISRKAIIVDCSAGIKLSVWVDGAGNTVGNQTAFPVLTDLDLLAPKPSVVTTLKGEWYFGKSIAPVVLNKKPETGSDGSQLRLNKRRGGGLAEGRGMEGS